MYTDYFVEKHYVHTSVARYPTTESGPLPTGFASLLCHELTNI